MKTLKRSKVGILLGLSLAFSLFQNCSLQSPEGVGTTTASSSQPTKADDIVLQSTPSNQTRFAGSSASFELVATSKTGLTLSYQWFKSGVQITGGTGSTLVLNNVQNADAGTYSVVVRNSLDEASASVSLTISPTPTLNITTQPAPITVAAGGSGRLTVAASSSDGQALTYQWYKDGGQLAGLTNSTLNIDNAAAVVAGVYQVEVRSTVGPQQSVRSNSVKVTVQAEIALGANGCVNGYCTCVTPGQLNVPYAPSALAICLVKGYTSLVTFATSGGVRGAPICSADGSGCFINQNPGNIVCSSVTCSR